MIGTGAPLLRRGDVVIGLVLLAFGAGATMLALDIPRGPQQRTLPPNTVPLICTLGIALCGAILTLRGLIVPQRAVPFPFDLRQALTAASFFAFFLLFEHVDFRLLITGFVVVVMALLGCRSWKQLVIVPLATTAGIWLFFVEIFNVFLPRWM